MQRLKTVLKSVLKSSGLEKTVAQNTALIIWDKIVGASIANNTEPTGVEHGIITVKTTSPAWRQELQFKKKDILYKLNKQLGKDTIKDIRFI